MAPLGIITFIPSSLTTDEGVQTASGPIDEDSLVWAEVLTFVGEVIVMVALLLAIRAGQPPNFTWVRMEFAMKHCS